MTLKQFHSLKTSLKEGVSRVNDEKFSNVSIWPDHKCHVHGFITNATTTINNNNTSSSSTTTTFHFRHDLSLRIIRTPKCLNHSTHHHDHHFKQSLTVIVPSLLASIARNKYSTSASGGALGSAI